MTVWDNVGKMNNKGFEMEVNYQKQINQDFGFSVAYNFSIIKNKMTELNGVDYIGLSSSELHGRNFDQETSRSAVGQPIGSFFVYEADGLFQNDAEIQNYKNDKGELLQPNAKPGDIRYKDISGPDGVPDGVINDLDRTIIGCAQPKLFGGFNNTFSYKNFDLNVNTIFTIGNDVYNGTRVTMENMQGSTNMFASTMNYWTPDNQNAPLPRPLRSKAVMRVSNQYVENGSYLRFQNITLGYNVPTEFLSFTKYVSGLRVYASLQNFFTITSYSGDNPEVSKYGQDNLGAGYDAFSYPFAKSVLFGLNVKF